jgi:hypothetical protein
MGTDNKEKVQFVISHLEGCSGNFLGYLIADTGHTVENVFRVDGKLNDQVLSINGRGLLLNQELDQRLQSHSVVVTHNYNLAQLQHTFPRAKLIQIYPHTHLGNVLYNVCYKKLTTKLDNAIDNYFIDIGIWFDRISKEYPGYDCINFWDLTNKNKIQHLLGAPLTKAQHQFFDRYWATQLPYQLDIPKEPMGIADLIKFWKIEHEFSPWFVAWVIFVYEMINNRSETSRLWSINHAANISDWCALEKIELQYDLD